MGVLIISHFTDEKAGAETVNQVSQNSTAVDFLFGEVPSSNSNLKMEPGPSTTTGGESVWDMAEGPLCR